MKKNLALAFGTIYDDDKKILALSEKQIRFLARESLAISGLVVAAYLSLIVVYGLPALFAFLGAFVGVVVFSGFRPYLEHAGTNTDRETDARTFEGPFFGFIFGEINYHSANHRYLGVPAYNPAELDAWLVANRPDEISGIRTRGVSELVTVLTDQKYGFAGPLAAALMGKPSETSIVAVGLTTVLMVDIKVFKADNTEE
jgi:hypothetical protein